MTVFGVDTQYQVIGTGKPLVLLHGWGCNWVIWYPVITDLSKSFQLIIPDLPAFGESDLHSDDWNSFHYAQWLEVFIQKVVGKKKFILAGHSFGGKIAAIYAASMQPPALQQLVLIDSSGLLVPLPPIKQLQEKVIQLVPARLKRLVRGYFPKQLVQSLGAADYKAASTQQQIIFKRVVKENIEPIIPNISTPTTLVWGDADLDTPVQHAYQLEQLLPKATLQIFKGVGHFPFIERPAEFSTLMKQLL